MPGTGITAVKQAARLHSLPLICTKNGSHSPRNPRRPLSRSGLPPPRECAAYPTSPRAPASRLSRDESLIAPSRSIVPPRKEHVRHVYERRRDTERVAHYRGEGTRRRRRGQLNGRQRRVLQRWSKAAHDADGPLQNAKRKVCPVVVEIKSSVEQSTLALVLLKTCFTVFNDVAYAFLGVESTSSPCRLPSLIS